MDPLWSTEGMSVLSSNKRKKKKSEKEEKKNSTILGLEPMTQTLKKDWDDSPETFSEAEAANRLTLQLEISAIHYFVF